MHTPEQAKDLWCPMARVAQIGAAETNATYNRALTKTHVPVKLADASPEGFELGEEPKPITATMLKVDLQISGAARCISTECAMWRWDQRWESVPKKIEGAGGQPVNSFEQRPVKTHGYCGLAPLHAI